MAGCVILRCRNKKKKVMKTETEKTSSRETDRAPTAEDRLCKLATDEKVRKKILAAYNRGRIDGRNGLLEELRAHRNAPLASRNAWRE